MMLALSLEETLAVREMPSPTPAPGEALIKVTMAGVCNTDIELVRGYMGFRGILGHEFVGIVESSANPYLMGKRVVGEINCVCHACTYCKMEMPHHCLNRTVLGILGRNGAFAEYLCLPEENLHLVPDSLPDEVAVFTEPVAAAFRIVEQINFVGTERVIVLGDGKLGQVIAQVLSLHARDMLCVGRHAWKLGLLKKLGIRTALTEEDIPVGADVVVDATGSQAGLNRALSLVRPEGTVVLKSTVANATPIEFSLPVINEIRILGSRCGPFRPALEALTLGNVDVSRLITEIHPLADADHALARAQSPGVMKVLIQP
jgi:threonine dehydrogenase-like Zn-dependent dehydrogenase